ncbi:unnamed protein product [Linum trigynum]|uniref:Transmembrane protein n=1 Tax=Linum trigynum TaxID=586398 RepID=A0AAV2FZ37_9ROSI
MPTDNSYKISSWKKTFPHESFTTKVYLSSDEIEGTKLISTNPINLRITSERPPVLEEYYNDGVWAPFMTDVILLYTLVLTLVIVCRVGLFHHRETDEELACNDGCRGTCHFGRHSSSGASSVRSQERKARKKTKTKADQGKPSAHTKTASVASSASEPDVVEPPCDLTAHEEQSDEEDPPFGTSREEGILTLA